MNFQCFTHPSKGKCLRPTNPYPEKNKNDMSMLGMAYRNYEAEKIEGIDKKKLESDLNELDLMNEEKSSSDEKPNKKVK